MKLHYFVFGLLLLEVLCLAQDAPIQYAVCAQDHARMPLMIGLINKVTPELRHVTDYMKRALEFTQQFSVSVQMLHAMPTTTAFKEFYKQGIAYVFFIEASGKNAFEWRLYDTCMAHMIKGKRYYKQGEVIRGWAYALADVWYETLLGKPGFFSTKIAYCKEIPTKYAKHYQYICIADYDGSHEQVLVNTPTINVAPKFNRDSTRPLVFYSENTNANVRMMASTMNKKHIMASNFTGLNMQPTFSADGNTVIYCATRGTGNCQLYQWHNKELKRITHNDGNNIAPCLSVDGKTVYFASDFETGMPSIYAYDITRDHLERITQDGFCVSPTVAGDLLAYCKSVKGIMQLFVYDIKTKQHAQLTFDTAKKEECCFSPCGTYLLCSLEDDKASQIALFNVITKEYTRLTNPEVVCSYPAWSGVYNQYPVVT